MDSLTKKVKLVAIGYEPEKLEAGVMVNYIVPLQNKKGDIRTIKEILDAPMVLLEGGGIADTRYLFPVKLYVIERKPVKYDENGKRTNGYSEHSVAWHCGVYEVVAMPNEIGWVNFMNGGFSSRPEDLKLIHRKEINKILSKDGDCEIAVYKEFSGKDHQPKFRPELIDGKVIIYI